MKIKAIVEPNLSLWRFNVAPATDAEIASLSAASPFPLPREFIELLRVSNGGEGWLAIRPWYFQLWSSTEIPLHNAGYETQKYFPEYIGFGSSGGGTMFAFHKDAGLKVFGIPFDTIDHRDIETVTESLIDFAHAMGREAQQAVQPEVPASGRSSG